MMTAHNTSLEHSTMVPMNMIFSSPTNVITFFARMFPINADRVPTKIKIPVKQEH